MASDLGCSKNINIFDEKNPNDYRSSYLACSKSINIFDKINTSDDDQFIDESKSRDDQFEPDDRGVRSENNDEEKDDKMKMLLRSKELEAASLFFIGDEMPLSNDFTDAECGEPMKSQHLGIDFTPIPGVDDNVHTLRKCLDFWQFVYNERRLEGFVSLPENNYEEVVQDVAKTITTISSPSIDWIQEGIGQDLALDIKTQKKFCDIDGKHGYESKASLRRIKKEDIDKTVESSARQTKPNTAVKKHTPLKHVHSSPNVVALCRQMEEWDLQHPKIMDPPGRVPQLTHAVLQRKIEQH